MGVGTVQDTVASENRGVLVTAAKIASLRKIQPGRAGEAQRTESRDAEEASIRLDWPDGTSDCLDVLAGEDIVFRRAESPCP